MTIYPHMINSLYPCLYDAIIIVILWFQNLHFDTILAMTTTIHTFIAT